MRGTSYLLAWRQTVSVWGCSLDGWRTTGTALVIDDDDGVRELARDVLQQAGMTVLTASDVYAAQSAHPHAGDQRAEANRGERASRLRAGTDHYRAIVVACQARMRPILMTTLTTILGMAPLIISRDPLFYDMAITIAFGLAFATLLTLGLAPVLYATFMRVSSPPR